MAKTVKVSIIVDDDGSMRLTEKSAQRLGGRLDKVGVSAQTADRRLKGAAQASSNTSKNFSKMAQGITGGLVPAYAVLAANVFAISAAFNFFKKAADTSILVKAQEDYTSKTGVGLKRIAQGLQEASDGMLTFQKSSEAAAIGVAKGFSPQQLNDLAIGARKASAALGRDFEESFDRLVRGVSKAEPELLDELGIVLRLEKATKSYGGAIGVAADKLNNFQKSQAILLEVQKQLDAQFGAVEPATNSFVKLQVAFDKIIKQVTQGILPAVEALANIITNNSTTAILAFGALGLSIAKAALPLEEWKQDFQDIGSAADTALGKLDMKIEKIKTELAEASVNANKLKAAASKSLQSAGATLAGQTQSKFAATLARGESISPINAKRFEKDLDRVEREIIKNGEVIKGVYKGASLEAVRAMKAALKQMEVANSAAAQKTTQTWKVWLLGFKKTMLQARSSAIGAFKRIGNAAATAGRIASKALSFAGFVGVFLLVKDLILGIVNNFNSLSKNVLGFVDRLGPVVRVIFGFILNTLGAIALGWTKIYNLTPLATEASRDFQKTLEDSKFNLAELASENGSLVKQYKDGAIGQAAAQQEELNKKNEIAKKRIEDLNKELESYSEAYENVNKLLKEGTALQQANSIVTLNTASIFRRSLAVLESNPDSNLEQIFENLTAVLPKVKTELSALGVTLTDTKVTGVGQIEAIISVLEAAGIKAREATTNTSGFANSIDSLTQTVNSFKDSGIDGLDAVLSSITAVEKSIKDATNSQSAFTGELSDFSKQFQDSFGKSLPLVQQLAERIRIVRSQTRAYLDTQRDLAVAQINISNLTGKAKEIETAKLKVLQETSKLQKIQNDIEAKGIAIRLSNQPNVTAGLVREQEALIRLRDIQKERIKLTMQQADEFDKLGKVIGGSLQDNLAKLITDVVSGTENFKDAAKSFVQSLAQTIGNFVNKIIALKILKALLPERLEIFLGLKPDPNDYAEIAALFKEAVAGEETKEGVRKNIVDSFASGSTNIKQTIDSSSNSFAAKLSDTFARGAARIAAACERCSCGSAGGGIPPSEINLNDGPTVDPSTLPPALRPSGNAAGIAADGGPLFNEYLRNRNAPLGSSTNESGVASNQAPVRPDSLPNFLESGQDPLGLNKQLEETLDKGIIKPTEQLAVQNKGFFGKLKGLFSGEGSFVTKLKGLFGGEGSFLSKLGGIFSGLFDKLGGLFGGGGGSGGGFMSLVKAGLGFFGFANGGMAPGGFRAYANGGIINKPTLGLVGEGKMNEAIVPLPDGKSIPVTGMGSSQTNNVSVGVTINNEGQAQATSSQDSNQAGNLGKAIAVAVQQELQNQKRPGGILSPYGAS